MKQWITSLFLFVKTAGSSKGYSSFDPISKCDSAAVTVFYLLLHIFKKKLASKVRISKYYSIFFLSLPAAWIGEAGGLTTGLSVTVLKVLNF